MDHGRAREAALFVFSFSLCFCASGCKREQTGQLTPAQIHQVTQELAKAASDAAPIGTLIKIRRARDSSTGAGANELYIGVRGNAMPVETLLRKLDGVATQHHLMVDAVTKSGNISRIRLRSAGAVTHRIEIEILSSRTNDNTLQPGQGRLAILLDDLGSDRGAADAIFALHVPITISVLPYHAHSQEIAQEARKHGCEVMLHLPMQSLANETPEQQELRPGLSRDEVHDIVTKMLEAVPEADGVNNHQGSQATSNSMLMEELMPILKDAGVFYVDSRTTAETVAYDTAKRVGVKTAFRNVAFLDDVQNEAAVKRQLQIAIRGAKEKREAVAIGHPHAATLEALREMLPEAKKQGVQLVFVSDVVH
ncbi:MAG TPA: divergent polysaccharide deacetylase family protein [Candidatus Acidoferrum sp.]